MRISLIFCIVILLLMTAALRAEETSTLPKNAQAALDKLQRNEVKLNQDHKKAVNAERVKTIGELEKALKDITKTGDLNAALAVKKQIDDLNGKIEASEDTDLLGNKLAIDYGKVLAGTWNFQKNSGPAGTMDILADGNLNASVTHPINLQVPGKWSVDKDGTITILWVNDPNRAEKLKYIAPNKLIGDSFDAGKNGFNATRQTK